MQTKQFFRDPNVQFENNMNNIVLKFFLTKLEDSWLRSKEHSSDR